MNNVKIIKNRCFHLDKAVDGFGDIEINMRNNRPKWFVMEELSKYKQLKTVKNEKKIE